MQATATFHTPYATRHLVALCQHFSKRVTASFTETTGHVSFPFGACELTADEARLVLTASGPDATQLDLLIDVITRHLERFAFRENPDLDWDVSPPARVPKLHRRRPKDDVQTPLARCNA